ncbi:MAG: hypothetical protein ACRBK7_14395 [Acidimicrobiales bacterium]
MSKPVDHAGVPQEPSAEMRKMARHIREVYVALLSEGFSAPEALSITGTLLAAHISRPPK